MDSPQPSISFDRAADVYDATRALPADVAGELTDALMSEIEAAGARGTAPGQVLEIGIGTGRISRPLAERGVRVCGVDISRRMMERLRAQLSDRHVEPDLLLGDATRLPLTSGTFRLAMAFHVLHLVPEWRQAADEIRRVLAPDGVFIFYLRRDEFARWQDSAEKWDEMLQARGFERRRRPSPDEVASRLRSLGGSCRTQAVATEEESMTPASMLEMTRQRTHSWTWEIPDDLWADCFAEYERWMHESGGPMDEPRVDTIVHELYVWRFADRV